MEDFIKDLERSLYYFRRILDYRDRILFGLDALFDPRMSILV